MPVLPPSTSGIQQADTIADEKYLSPYYNMYLLLTHRQLSHKHFARLISQIDVNYILIMFCAPNHLS